MSNDISQIKSTNLIAEVRADVKLTDDDRVLIGQAITIIQQAANRYIKDSSTRKYISFLLTLVQSVIIGAI